MSDAESESCGVLLPAAAAAVHAAMVPAGWMESLWRTQPGVSVSSVCDGVVLASSVAEVAVQVEEIKEELHHGRL